MGTERAAGGLCLLTGEEERQGGRGGETGGERGDKGGKGEKDSTVQDRSGNSDSSPASLPMAALWMPLASGVLTAGPAHCPPLCLSSLWPSPLFSNP